MIDPDFLRRCGIVIEPEFLDPQACLRVAGIMARRRQVSPALVHEDGLEAVVTSLRRANIVALPPAIVLELEKRLDDWQPRIAEHFKVELGVCQVPQFMRYTQGDFFRAHVDCAYGERSTSDIVRRRVSVVIFLNAPYDEAGMGGYSGGDLVLYGLLPGEKWKHFGAAVPARPGMLVAFPSDLRHEVTEVTGGMRATIVSWYLAPES